MATAEENKEVKSGTAEKALENEAAESTIVTVDYDGKKYTFDVDDMNDTEFMREMEKEHLSSAIEILIGKSQFQKFLSTGTKGKRKLQELNDFAEKMFDELGASPGE